jgi:hypothetical protein
VLCYLEGLTQDEAALRLGWSKSTCRRKLEGGRELLGARLARRGVTLSAILLAPLLSECAAVAAPTPAFLAATAKGLVAMVAGKVEGPLAGGALLVSERAVGLAEGLQPVGLAWQWKSLGALALGVLLAGLGSATAFWPSRSGTNTPPSGPPSEPLQVVTNERGPDREGQQRAAPVKFESKVPTLILDRKVQAELHLTEDQVRKIRDAVQEAQSRHKDAPDTPREGRLNPVPSDETFPVHAPPSGAPGSLPARREATREQTRHPAADFKVDLKLEAEKEQVLREVLPGLLTPDQVRRFRQVELQAAGLGAFIEPTVEQVLALTGEQKATLRAFAREPEDAASRVPGAGAERYERTKPGQQVPDVETVPGKPGGPVAAGHGDNPAKTYLERIEELRAWGMLTPENEANLRKWDAEEKAFLAREANKKKTPPK